MLGVTTITLMIPHIILVSISCSPFFCVSCAIVSFRNIFERLEDSVIWGYTGIVEKWKLQGL